MSMSFSTSDVLTGLKTLAHVGGWLTSSFSDTLFVNPKYNRMKKGVAVYFIPGTADRSGAYNYIVEVLLDKSYGISEKISALHLPTFEKRFQGVGIEELAEQLKNKMIANEETDVVIVGHSRGGLVGAYLQAFLAANIKVHAVICLASPFGGSSAAAKPLSSLSTSVHQMEISSDFLKKLNAEVIKHTIYRYLVAPGDGLVSEEAACPPEHKEYRRSLSVGNHLSMMREQTTALYVFQQIAEAIKGFVQEDLKQPKEFALEAKASAANKPVQSAAQDPKSYVTADVKTKNASTVVQPVALNALVETTVTVKDVEDDLVQIDIVSSTPLKPGKLSG